MIDTKMMANNTKKNTPFDIISQMIQCDIKRVMVIKN
jgi:hypothetical protein